MPQHRVSGRLVAATALAASSVWLTAGAAGTVAAATCAAPQEQLLEWTDLGVVDGSHPANPLVASDFGGTGVDVTFTYDTRSADTNYSDEPDGRVPPYNPYFNTANLDEVLRWFFNPTDGINATTLSFSQPVQIDEVLIGGARDIVGRAALAFTAFDAAGDPVLPVGVAPDSVATFDEPNPIDQTVAINTMANAAGQGFVGYDDTGADAGSYVMVGDSGGQERPWAVLNYNGATVSSIVWEHFGTTSTDPAAARDNIDSVRFYSAYLGNFQITVPSPCYDLAVVKDLASPPASVSVGDEVTYTVTARNQGADPSGTFTLLDTLPEGMSYVSDTSGITPTVDAGAGTVEWVVPAADELLADEELSFELVVRVDDASFTSYRNDIEITADSGDDVDSDPSSGDAGLDPWDDHDDPTVDVDGPGDAFDDHDAEVFTNDLPPASVSVGDFVFIDANGDGVQDAGDVPVEGATLTLTGPGGGPVTDVFGDPVGPVTTDADGLYLFEGLPVLAPGESYTVTIDPSTASALDGFVPTGEGVGSDPAVDSSTGSASSGDLTVDGAEDRTLDFGFVPEPDPPPLASVSVGDFVFIDANGDGVQDAGDVPVEGATLTLTGPGGGPVTDVFGDPVGPVTTDADGLYLFEDLPVLAPGESYTVTIDPSTASALDGFVPTGEGVGSDPAVDSSTGSASSGDLTVDGAEDRTLDFGFIEGQVAGGGPTTTTTTTTTTTPPTTTPPTTQPPRTDILPATGSDSRSPLPAALALLVLGAALAALARRRSELADG